MTSLAMPSPNARTRALAIDARTIAVALVGLLGVQNVLLLAFLGFNPVWIAGAGTLLAILLVILLRDQRLRTAISAPIGWRLLLGCMLVALVVYVLGGEGRFFYANTDWQVRGAVLNDLARYPWPFVYNVPSASDPSGMILRAPLGMYLLPAVIGKALGAHAAELAMLLQNSVMLGAVLAAGSRLFATRRDYMLAGVIFFGFSGMDICSQWLTGQPLDIHLEQALGLQYSAHLTQAFWVPQHALAGWIGALFYLLWREGKLSLTALAAAMPLLALLSPLALMGLLPFACHAGVTTLIKRELRWADIFLPALALLIALPALLFMASGSSTVGGQVTEVSPLVYAIFILFEVGLPLTALFLHGRAHHYGLIVSLIVTLVLLLAPFGVVGNSTDFVMRASIPALAILSVLIARILAARPVTERQRAAVKLALWAWVIGLATPLSETARAIRFPAAPRVLCSYFGVVPGGAATYVTPLRSLATLVRPVAPTHVVPKDPAYCWDGPWPAAQEVGLLDQMSSDQAH